MNEFVGKPPVDRGRPLASNRDEVAFFAESGGLVVSTHDLLALVLRVDRGETTAEAARATLWDQSGYFELSGPPAAIEEVPTAPPTDSPIEAG